MKHRSGQKSTGILGGLKLIPYERGGKAGQQGYDESHLSKQHLKALSSWGAPAPAFLLPRRESKRFAFSLCPRSLGGSAIALWPIISCLYGITFSPQRTWAQLQPDQTLGSEASQVSAIDALNQRIDGGAARGSNLFHSFQEFNVGEGRGVYFANPTGIENILSRVTGSNPSYIFGRLGVLGSANLYLLNPQGIVFGPQASLDIQGSFYGTTANEITLGDQGVFSAVAPQQSQLLSVSPSANFLTQAANHGGSIINQGQLAVGQDLTLSAGQLNLQGQLLAGHNLTLQAAGIQIRDSEASPFIAAAGDRLLVQGNQSVDIFALNHPESGLFSGGDLVLRSVNPVRGDAHYGSGGNFRIETIDQNLGALLSLEEPVIRSLGDVSFDSYFGTSLHILAGGKVEIPSFIQITGADPVNGVIETVTLSNGSSVFINSQAEPTLDIRAGVNPSAIEGVFFNPADFFPFNGDNFLLNPGPFDAPVLSSIPTSADIRVGSVIFAETSFSPLAGRILLTNQYKPNLSLNGDIQIFTSEGQIILTGGVSGGSVDIDARGSIELNGIIDTSSVAGIDGIFQGDGGDLTLIAGNNISVAPDSLLVSSGQLGGEISLVSNNKITISDTDINNSSSSLEPDLLGGSINIESKELALNFSRLSTSTSGQVNAGDIYINVAEEASFMNASQLRSFTFGQGNSGNITIDAPNANVIFDGIENINGTPERSGVVSSVFGSVTDITGQPFSGTPQGGDITIKARSLSLTNSAVLSTEVFGIGNAGDIFIKTTDTILLEGSRKIEVLDFRGNLVSLVTVPAINTNIQPGSIGQGGHVDISASSLILDSGATITTVTLGSEGNMGRSDAGDITVHVDEHLSLRNGSQLRSDTFGQGGAGNIIIDAASADVVFDGVEFFNNIPNPSGISSSAFIISNGQAGNINIVAKSLSLTNGGSISSQTFGHGDAGNVFIDVTGSITLEGDRIIEIIDSLGNSIPSEFFPAISTTVGPRVMGRGGRIDIFADSLVLNNRAQIATSTLGSEGVLGRADAGNIMVTVNDHLSLMGGAQFRSDTFGEGDGGAVTIHADDAEVSFDGFEFEVIDGQQSPVVSGISSAVSFFVNPRTGEVFRGNGSAGDVSITAKSFSLTNSAQLNTLTAGKGNAGDVSIDVDNSISLDGGFIFSTAEMSAVGIGGNVEIRTGSISLDNSSQIVTNTFSPIPILKFDPVFSIENSKAGDISIISDEFISLNNNSGILSSVGNFGIGDSGKIDIKTPSLSLVNGSQIQAILFRTRDGLPGGQGVGGSITIDAQDSVTISGVGATGFSSGLLVLSERGAFGPAGTIAVKTGSFQVDNGAIVAAGNFNDGGDGGGITIKADTFNVLNGGQILTNTRGSGNAGFIKLEVRDSVLIDGEDTNFNNRLNLAGQNLESTDQLDDVVINEGPASGLFANTGELSSGNGGNISIDPQIVTIQNGGVVAVNSRGTGAGGTIQIDTGSLVLNNAAISSASSQTGNAGSITLKIDNLFSANNSDITTSATQASGGAINITARNIRLNGDSDIRTNVLFGAGGGGDITLTADSILAFGDSDILAFADPSQGRGGNITLNTPAFFGENFFGLAPPGTNLRGLDGNNRVDINATGATSGLISIPDVSFIQNNLTDLPENLINTENLLANSCIVRTTAQQGKFVITGAGGLPVRPSDAAISPFPTGDVQSIPSNQSLDSSKAERPWQLGDPVVEPQGIYQLTNGQLVMSRECSQL